MLYRLQYSCCESILVVIVFLKRPYCRDYLRENILHLRDGIVVQRVLWRVGIVEETVLLKRRYCCTESIVEELVLLYREYGCRASITEENTTNTVEYCWGEHTVVEGEYGCRETTVVEIDSGCREIILDRVLSREYCRERVFVKRDVKLCV